MTDCSQSKTAKGIPFSLQLWPEKDKIADTNPRHITDYKEESHDIYITDVKNPAITVYAIKTEEKRPAVLVCPGGGYGILAYIKEGIEIAEWLNSVGITAIVLKYTVPKDRDAALNDIVRAMGMIRNNAEQWDIDPNQLGVMGFSAGAHLSARLSNNFTKRTYPQIDAADSESCKPDFTILVYPAYLETLTVSKDSPATFILQTRDDKPYIDSTEIYIEKLKEQGIPSKIHLFDNGGHGYGMRATGNPVSKWPELLKQWLHKIAIIK